MRSSFGIGMLALLAAGACVLVMAGCQQSAPGPTALDTAKLKQITVSVTGMT